VSDLPSGLRVALVHDWLTGMRGGEKVLESVCRIAGDADLLTLVHVPGTVSTTIASRHIRTSFVQHLPGAGRWYRQYLPLFPVAVEMFDLDDVDLVISTSHCAAKSVVPTGRAVHVCYCHSPMRYAWDQFEAYFGRERVGPVRHALARPVLAWLARWDRATAGRVDRYLANSEHVAGRIARYYNRRASVLYPPVDTEFFTPGSGGPEPYFLGVSALVPYKRIDVAMAAAARLGVALKIVGTGPDRARLEAAAGPDVEFLGALDAAELRTMYRHATALVLPAEEDFGIAPVESLACGRPVIALGRGGACESVKDGETGVLVGQATAEAFADAMAHVQRRRYDPAALRATTAPFTVQHFEDGFRAAVASALTSGREC